MSTTSKKIRDFVSEPMNDKSVRLLAGVGDRLGERLEAIGYDKAYTVLGQVSDPSDRCYHFLNIFAQKGLT
jgi:hypothetical protein